jgi:hypothetical protein
LFLLKRKAPGDRAPRALRPCRVHPPDRSLVLYCHDNRRCQIAVSGYANRSAPACVNVRYPPDGCSVSQPCAIAAVTAARYGWLQVKCHRCETEASIPLDAIRRPRDTPIWKLEAALKCRCCGTRRYKPPVYMVKLTQEREITPYVWVHPDEER